MKTRRTLIVMAKQPRLGRVKTRLASDIGPVAATMFYRRNLARTLRVLGGDPRWRLVVATAPDRWRPRGVASMPQGYGDLGARMRRCLNACLPGNVVLIGADIPAVEPRHIAHAFAILRRHSHVMGPASDGGYWLIGARRARAPPCSCALVKPSCTGRYGPDIVGCGARRSIGRCGYSGRPGCGP